MDKCIEDINTFLQWYKNIYGGVIYVDGEITESSLIESKPSNVSSPAKPIEKNSKSDLIIHQRSPELEQFYLEIKDCRQCPLGATRTNLVFGAGNPNAKVMFIGEAPGEDEDKQGVPFVGRAGKLFDKMLKTISLSREDIYIANILKCRPPRNRDPLPEEIKKCELYLKKQLNMISPKILVALGRIAGQVLLNRYDNPLRVLRESTHEYEGMPLIVTYHPAALLRNSQWKRAAWEDFKKLKKMLKNDKNG
jgi:DNA polymerase